ncbi:MAG: protein-disulfide reductase DsbD family protein [Gammaproteobacteria bacterium]|jgi:thiol:disulfide interchange protein DsbD|nr:protein-disulfide reductase DsbD family protein [Gammaproteobacteria bacterium]MDA9355910.1 protein-disulfide reductase DsbD family protein [Gammaproteobacteria bacterium]MDC1189878.1 protein-disulfide reductase DsbD family protein [Gammaproteobacteria bacterium]|tara:strand:- start:4564 stop:4992 length:429 start_codon:yes stop_codon:yes gene_type:complete
MKKILSIILTSYSLIMPSHASVLFDEQESIPLAKDVFVISQGQASESIYISWNIKDGYYMYLDSIKLKDITNNIPFEIVESHQSLFEDEFFGKTEILKKNLTLIINKSDISNSSELLIYYQGCSEDGFCYPVQKDIIINKIL